MASIGNIVPDDGPAVEALRLAAVPPGRSTGVSTILSAHEEGRRDITRSRRSCPRHRDDQGLGATAITLPDSLMPTEIMLIVMTMMGAASLVLLIACANVANLPAAFSE
jgi:hypothetical protein